MSRNVAESMTHGANGTDAYLATHKAVAANLPAAGTQWVDQHRKHARDQFCKIGFPSLRDEQWKYTNVRPITRQTFDLPLESTASISETWLNKAVFPTTDAYQLVFADGIFIPGLSRFSDCPKGVVINGLADLLRTNPERVKDKLGCVFRQPTHGFNAMNSAFALDGAFIEIESNAMLDKPLELVYISGPNGEEKMSLPRNLIFLHSGSQATVCERYISENSTRSLTSAVSEVLMGEGSELTHSRLQDENEKSFHVGGLFAEVGRNARLTTNVATLGGALVRNDLVINLNKNGAQAHLHGLYLGRNRQHIDNNTRVSHNSRETNSYESYKGVLTDRARAVFRGHILVQPDAQKTDAVQKNHNLLLSQDSEVDTMPQLEIYADDVKCAHGASVGQLEQDAVFYLRARGIDDITARKMLTKAFVSDILTELNSTQLTEYVEHRINQLLGVL